LELRKSSGEYNVREIEAKWRRYWEEKGLHKVNLGDSEKKTYCLVMFSYPSADKLHIGHWFNFGPTDTWARFKRMQGHNVFEPMGFDSFGLPAENYAVKKGVHPEVSTAENIDFIRGQLKRIGAMYDWDKEVVTSSPEYYRWTQWMFLKLYERGLAYRRKATVNWCPTCGTVLANEQVVGDGECDYCGEKVTKKDLKQWFFKITEYADRLIEGLDRIDWPERTKLAQKNWIGRKEGVEIDFIIPAEFKSSGGADEKLPVFTTRPDTVFGVTYVVLAPEHPLVGEITTPENADRVKEYVEGARAASELEREAAGREKTGVPTGAYAVNPLSGERIAVWVADYVITGYGTGAIMAVPAHDERDFEFATKFGLPIRKVILEAGTREEDALEAAYTGRGTMVNSGEFTGLSSEDGFEAVARYVQENGCGRRVVNYHLRDWLVSRQRYWGAPIPMIYCDKCGDVPVPEEDLPVLLPKDVTFKRSEGISPLASSKTFSNVVCPQCGGPAKRELDTMDTFVCSSWYYLRYLSPHDDERAFDPEMAKKWLPVDKYVGGFEHACGHLIYARFFGKVLYDMGLIPTDEPFASLTHQGVITKDGAKMSKSKGNVVNPEKYIEEFGADAFRMYLMFSYDYRDGGNWDDKGVFAIDRFLRRTYRLVKSCAPVVAAARNRETDDRGDSEAALDRARHYAVKHVTLDLERFHFNTCISRCMELVNEAYRYVQSKDQAKWDKALLRSVLQDLVKLLGPFAPHLGEEMWRMIGGKGSLFLERWPEYDEKVLQVDEVTVVIQINGKIRAKMPVPKGLAREEMESRSLRHDRIRELLREKAVKKVICVPDKLVNIVT